MLRSTRIILVVIVAALLVAGCSGGQAQPATSTAARATTTAPTATPAATPAAATATPQPTPSPAPSATPGVAAGLPLPAGVTALREATADLKGDGQKQRLVVGAYGVVEGLLSAEATELFLFAPVAGGHELVWRSEKLAGQRAEGLRVEDVNRDGRTEVLSLQSMGAAGETLYVVAWLGDRFGLLTPRGGYFDGRQSFGETGVRVEDLNGDGLPEIVAAYSGAAAQSEVYRWDGRDYYASAAPAPGGVATRTATPGQTSGLVLTLSSRAATYTPGARATFTLVAHNAGTTPVSLTFPSAQRFDLVVEDSVGRELWRWSAGKVFAQVMGTQQLAPGQNLSYEVVWDQKSAAGVQVAPGNYAARAWLTARGIAEQPRAEFAVR